MECHRPRAELQRARVRRAEDRCVDGLRRYQLLEPSRRVGVVQRRSEAAGAVRAPRWCPGDCELVATAAREVAGSQAGVRHPAAPVRRLVLEDGSEAERTVELEAQWVAVGVPGDDDVRDPEIRVRSDELDPGDHQRGALVGIEIAYDHGDVAAGRDVGDVAQGQGQRVAEVVELLRHGVARVRVRVYRRLPGQAERSLAGTGRRAGRTADRGAEGGDARLERRPGTAARIIGIGDGAQIRLGDVDRSVADREVVLLCDALEVFAAIVGGVEPVDPER